MRERTLLATPFDPTSGELGETIPLVEDVLIDTAAALGIFSVTEDGELVYMTGAGETEQVLQWLGAGNALLGKVGEPGRLQRPRVSPDGREAVVEVFGSDSESADLWLVDLANGLRSRFTFEPGYEGTGIWTPDGTRVVYAAIDDSTTRIMARPVEGTGTPTQIHVFDGEAAPTGISPDGGTLYLTLRDPETDWDVYSMPVEGGEPTVLVRTPLIDYAATVSPDGKWLLYGSGTGSDWDVYVRPVSGGDRRWQIDHEEGLYPFWGARGESVFYVRTNGDLDRVEVDGRTDTFRSGAPVDFATVTPPSAGGNHVSLHPDGERVLVVSGDLAESETAVLQFVTDWTRGLTK